MTASGSNDNSVLPFMLMHGAGVSGVKSVLKWSCRMKMYYKGHGSVSMMMWCMI